MQEIVRTDSRRNRDLLEVVIQKNEEKSVEDTRHRLPGILSKGSEENSGPSSYTSKRSTSYSRGQYSNENVATKKDLKEPYVHKMINSLGLLSIVNLVMSFITLQVIVAISEFDVGHPRNTSILTSQKSYGDLLEVTSAFASFVFGLDMCSMVICCMQFYFSSKILTVQDGRERAAKYLADCSSSRFIAVLGFFISIPAFLITIICYVLLKMRSTPAITMAVILSIAIIICGVSIFQNVYHWQDEIGQANDGLSIDADPDQSSTRKRSKIELNTLV